MKNKLMEIINEIKEERHKKLIGEFDRIKVEMEKEENSQNPDEYYLFQLRKRYDLLNRGLGYN